MTGTKGAVVLDTDAVSLLQRGEFPKELATYLKDSYICVTFITVGELFQGAYQRGWGQVRLNKLRDWLTNVLVLQPNFDTARKWGDLRATGRKKGKTIPANDAWIAACCIGHEVPLITFHVSHFRDIEGLQLIK